MKTAATCHERWLALEPTLKLQPDRSPEPTVQLDASDIIHECWDDDPWASDDLTENDVEPTLVELFPLGLRVGRLRG